MKNRHWIMSSEALTTLRKLRKRIQAEFGTDLKLSEEGLEQRLARTKRASVDTETRGLITHLEELHGEPFLSGDEPPPRLYRGRPILEEPCKRDIYAMIYGRDLTRHTSPAAQGSKPVKMYRGTPIED